MLSTWAQTDSIRIVVVRLSDGVVTATSWDSSAGAHYAINTNEALLKPNIANTMDFMF